AANHSTVLVASRRLVGAPRIAGSRRAVLRRLGGLDSARHGPGLCHRLGECCRFSLRTPTRFAAVGERDRPRSRPTKEIDDDYARYGPAGTDLDGVSRSPRHGGNAAASAADVGTSAPFRTSTRRTGTGRSEGTGEAATASGDAEGAGGDGVGAPAHGAGPSADPGAGRQGRGSRSRGRAWRAPAETGRVYRDH